MLQHHTYTEAQKAAAFDRMFAKGLVDPSFLIVDFSQSYVRSVEEVLTYYRQAVVTDPTTGKRGVSLHSVGKVMPPFTSARSDWAKVHSYCDVKDPRFFRLPGFKRSNPKSLTPFIEFTHLRETLLAVWPVKGKRALKWYDAHYGLPVE